MISLRKCFTVSAVAAHPWTNYGGGFLPTEVEASTCRAGTWKNHRDGTCTKAGYHHCHDGKSGLGWQCPNGKACVFGTGKQICR